LQSANIKLKNKPGFFRKLAFCNFHFSMKFSVPFQNAKLIPFSFIRSALDGDFDQRRCQVGQEAGPAHSFWDALTFVRPFNHPESHGQQSMAFFSRKKKRFLDADKRRFAGFEAKG